MSLPETPPRTTLRAGVGVADGVRRRPASSVAYSPAFGCGCQKAGWFGSFQTSQARTSPAIAAHDRVDVGAVGIEITGEGPGQLATAGAGAGAGPADTVGQQAEDADPAGVCLLDHLVVEAPVPAAGRRLDDVPAELLADPADVMAGDHVERDVLALVDAVAGGDVAVDAERRGDGLSGDRGGAEPGRQRAQRHHQRQEEGKSTGSPHDVIDACPSVCP